MSFSLKRSWRSDHSINNYLKILKFYQIKIPEISCPWNDSHQTSISVLKMDFYVKILWDKIFNKQDQVVIFQFTCQKLWALSCKLLLEKHLPFAIKTRIKEILCFLIQYQNNDTMFPQQLQEDLMQPYVWNLMHQGLLYNETSILFYEILERILIYKNIIFYWNDKYQFIIKLWQSITCPQFKISLHILYLLLFILRFYPILLNLAFLQIKDQVKTHILTLFNCPVEILNTNLLYFLIEMLKKKEMITFNAWFLSQDDILKAVWHKSQHSKKFSKINAYWVEILTFFATYQSSPEIQDFWLHHELPFKDLLIHYKKFKMEFKLSDWVWEFFNHWHEFFIYEKTDI